MKLIDKPEIHQIDEAAPVKNQIYKQLWKRFKMTVAIVVPLSIILFIGIIVLVVWHISVYGLWHD